MHFKLVRKLSFLLVAPVVLGATLVCASGSAFAGETYRNEYRVTLLGLSIARATFVTEVTRPGYTITGTISSAGIANVFTSLDAKTKVTGLVADDKHLQASNYNLVYTRGKRTRVYDVRYAGGNVVSTTITPEPNRNKDRWIPVSAGDLRSVLDPVGGLTLPDDGKICSRTLPIFDGESRLDLVMSPKGKNKFTAGNVSGEAIVCSVRYVPKSGFNKGRSDIEYLRSANDMEIWFAKTGTMTLYAPVYARVPTRVGTLSITATRFGA
ncbi:DUF3108 domain-containing protein [Agrobacterium vitis]|uniref:DUF3108 domain-containing protein n=1 Tax=Agrobacterium vitis TaxID=373 RepID=A0AAE4WD49_AGRVI|nr:DUF3108 domain-containing protein [Agrobacterium vitis]MCF1498045.1 DUF3108 domain-containing protein [Allorhizobium sp. Av2]MUZ57964.1 DUF3108 domain-containing protein [Agrobacterium vitis]MVA67510.1 DUF3108 domain-containing protein [Agrobacterium vitis]MVA86844.1 DUF3108 domain-containing protein [Agrobacterium vitis]